MASSLPFFKVVCIVLFTYVFIYLKLSLTLMRKYMQTYFGTVR